MSQCACETACKIMHQFEKTAHMRLDHSPVIKSRAQERLARLATASVLLPRLFAKKVTIIILPHDQKLTKDLTKWTLPMNLEWLAQPSTRQRHQNDAAQCAP